jgi:hypothetical protein
VNSVKSSSVVDSAWEHRRSVATNMSASFGNQGKALYIELSRQSQCDKIQRWLSSVDIEG